MGIGKSPATCEVHCFSYGAGEDGKRGERECRLGGRKGVYLVKGRLGRLKKSPEKESYLSTGEGRETSQTGEMNSSNRNSPYRAIEAYS